MVHIRQVIPLINMFSLSSIQIILRAKETEQAHLCLGFKGLPIGGEDVYSLIVLNNVLGGSMSSRLFQEVREQRGLAYSVFSYHSSYRDSGLVTIYGELEAISSTYYMIRFKKRFMI